MSSADSATQTDQGQLGLWDAISIITGIVIGTSIFKIPWLIFLNVPDPWTGLLVWIFGGFLALVGGLCYAELATSYPRSGGDYVYLSRAFGSGAGFLFGWAQIAVVLTSSIGAMAFVFAENATSLYKLDQLTDAGLSSEFLYATLAVAVISVLNIVGVTTGKWTQNLLTFAKVVGLGAIIFAGFYFAESSPRDWRFADPSNMGWGALALIFVLYAYGGWNDAAFVAAEVRNVRRNIPLALILGIGLITTIYILVNAAYLVGLGFEAARTPGLPQLLLERLAPGYGGKAITVIIMISALGAVNGLTFTGARVYATLGTDHALFGWLGHWRPGQGASVAALVLQALMTLAVTLALCTENGHNGINQVLTDLNSYLRGRSIDIGISSDRAWNPEQAFEALVSHSAPVFWFFFLLTGLSIFMLRLKDPYRERPFTVPGYPVLPLIFCAMCVYMLYRSTIFVGYRSLFAVGLVLLGVPLYVFSLIAGMGRNRHEGPLPITGARDPADDR